MALSDEQITTLANGQMRINEFFPTIGGTFTVASADGDTETFDVIPAVGGREITDPIQVATYNLDPAVNRALHLNTAKVWLACWEPDPSSDSVDSFDFPGRDALQDLRACSAAKLDAVETTRDIRVAVATARADQAEAAADQAALDAASAVRDSETSQSILDILRGRD